MVCRRLWPLALKGRLVRNFHRHRVKILQVREVAAKMLCRILTLTLCLSCFAPTCSPQDGTSGSAEASQSREQEAATVSAAAAAPGSPQPLSPEEDSSLSARAEEPGPEVSGGALSNLHLTYVVIALAAILLVLLIK